MVKFMLQRPILSGRVGKWIYSLVEYDLLYEPLQAVRGQVVADFIMDHGVIMNEEVDLVETHPWLLFFDRSVCSKGQGVGCQILSLTRESYELAVWLAFACTNNQAKYEALMCGLEFMPDIDMRNISAFGDSRLIVQQMNSESQCLEGMLNSYHDACLDIVKSIDDFLHYLHS
jgi:hypothetical protein